MLAVVAVAVVYLGFNKPTPGGPFPPCLFYVSTGLYCPGCGGTRAVHLLLQGDILGAAGQNALALLALPLGAVYAAALAVYAASGKWSPPAIRGRWLVVGMGVVIVLFAVLRNLPWFSALAPTPLP